MKEAIHVAVIDCCDLTIIGLQYLFNHEPNVHRDVLFHGFSNTEDFLLSERTWDIVIYDPLNIGSFMITPDEDIRRIKREKPSTRIYIYSLSVGFLKFNHVDGVINKRISLGDIKAIWQILMSQVPRALNYYNAIITMWQILMSQMPNALNHYNVRITMQQPPESLSNQEACVLRGYSFNLTTKQIARQLGCNVRQVYFYKNNAINKLKAARGPFFYKSIRWVLN